MAIHKDTPTTLRKSGGNYVVLPNDSMALIKDPVSLAIWAYLLSKPDNWIVRSAEIQDRFCIGRDKTTSSIGHLRDLGLVWDEFMRDGSGKVTGRNLVCSSQPNDEVAVLRVSRTTDEPYYGKGVVLVSKDPLVIKDKDSNKRSTDGASANAEPPASVEQKSQAKNTPYQSILDAYHKLLPEMPAIRELTDSRKTKIRNFWSKFKFNEERWEAYLQYIATNCRWMCEARKRRDGESSWKPKNLEFLITERCYLGVREGRFDDE